ncbi:protein AUXIN RESPONSE 4 [Trifolium pratense]|uniref:protein AUXIN RESPONSE 4 n=1 Tax=Trifolium pratense TaxID=57577 RepID=UPI001E6914D4|nr:protein AUXIN RESPONSE 4 [Trifolium pratense]
MAILTEEQNQQQPKQHSTKTKTKSSHKPKTQQPQLSFWFYFTLSISLITLFFFFFFFFIFTSSSLSPQKSLLNLPTTLRKHYSNGRTIKVQIHPNQPPIQLFTFQRAPNTQTPSETVLILHGQALSSYSYRNLVQSLSTQGVRVIAIDLPGNGFSDKSVEVSVEGLDGIFGRFSYVYSEIQEKGFFWAFDQIVETGQIPYEEVLARMSKRKVSIPVDLGPEEIGKVLGQVIDTLGLAPVHLVLHDSALGFAANWVSENSNLVSSLTLVDTPPLNSGAFPIWVLEVPLIREVVLGLPLVFEKVVNFCCSKRIGGLDADAHRVLLKTGDGRKAVVATGKNLNSSFDLAEWGGSDGLKDMPMQLIWSSDWSEEWIREGNQVAGALPRAKFVTHSGGRWAQEDVAVEIAGKISQFVLSLPKTVRKVEQESSIPDHIQEMFDEAKTDGHGHDRLGEDDIHEVGYMDAYGLGHGPRDL